MRKLMGPGSGQAVVCGMLVALVFASPGQGSHARDKPATNCPYAEQEWMESKLFFGLSRSGGAAVSRREWDQFVSDHFVVSFPNGFTIMETTGYWRDQTTNATVYENGKQVIILHEATSGNETMINEIAEKYRSQFDQQSVLISSRSANVRFCEKP